MTMTAFLCVRAMSVPTIANSALPRPHPWSAVSAQEDEARAFDGFFAVVQRFSRLAPSLSYTTTDARFGALPLAREEWMP